MGKTKKLSESTFNIKTIIIIFATLCLLAVISFIVNFAVNHDKTASIRILVSPVDATVKIDDSTYTTNETIRVTPGKHSVGITTPEIEDFSFDPYFSEIEAIDGETVSLFVVLTEPDGQNYYLTHEKDMSRVEEISSSRAKEQQDTYANSDPIFQITPYKNYDAGYIVSPTLSEDKIVTINISLLSCVEVYREDAKSKAISWLKKQNIDLDNYEVVYKNGCADD